MTDYKDWLSRFLGIYRFPNRGEVERVQSALDWLEENKPSQEELDKIWAGQVARNIYRDKQLRERKSIKRDTTNLFKFFKEKHWGNLIPSTTDDQRETGHSQCCECGLSRPSNERGWIIREEKTFCTPCWAKKYEDGPTGFKVLRQAYGRRIPQNPGETGPMYIARTFGSGKKRSMGTDKPEVSSDGRVHNPGPKGLPEDEWNHG